MLLELQIKQLSLYQLPPRSFWAWWCEGLSPVDLILWLGVWALMVSWAWQLTEGVWARIYSASFAWSDAIRHGAVFSCLLYVWSTVEECTVLHCTQHAKPSTFSMSQVTMQVHCISLPSRRDIHMGCTLPRLKRKLPGLPGTCRELYPPAGPYCCCIYHQAESGLCRVATRVGFAAMAGFLCLFYLIPRNSFIQHLFRCDFSALLRYHR